MGVYTTPQCMENNPCKKKKKKVSLHRSLLHTGVCAQCQISLKGALIYDLQSLCIRFVH
jgi:hypothetical protein